jgi:hypothetical protein
MTLDNRSRKIGDPGPSRAGNAIAIDDKEPIGNRHQIPELLDKVAVVIPADAALSPFEQS